MTAVCTLIPNTTNVGMSAASSNGKKTDNGDTWIFQLSSFPAFIALLDVAIFRDRIRFSESFLLILVTLGLILVTHSFGLGNQGTLALLWGLGAGLVFALLALFGGEDRRHLEMLVDGEKPQAEGKNQRNPAGDPDRGEYVAQQNIERASQQNWRGINVT
ncbi:hypothetical protein D9M71_661700 [compost metagenome]